VDNILSNTLLPELSRQLLGRMAEEQQTERVLVGLGPEGNFQYSW
jgi:type VI secretion system protein VasG